MLGQTEGGMEDYTDAIRDELTLSKLAEALSGGAYLAESSLSDVAGFECHGNLIDAGIAHARQVITEWQGSFDSAGLPERGHSNSCRMQDRQDGRGKARASSCGTGRSESAVSSVNIEVIAQTPGYANVEGNVDAARARLALLEGKLDSAKFWRV